MKKVLLSVLCILVLVLAAGCSKTEEAPVLPVAVEDEPVVIIEEAPAKPVPYQDAVVLYDDAGLYHENEDGKMAYSGEYVLAGETVTVYMLNGEVLAKTAPRIKNDGSEDEASFVCVRYFDNDYWIRDIFVSRYADARPAVVLADSFMYKSADVTEPYPSSQKLKAGTIVAILAEEDGFYEVSYYNGETNGKEVYLKKSAVTVNEGDVMIIQISSAAKDTKNLKPEVQEQLYWFYGKLESSEEFWQSDLSAQL